MNTSKRSSRPVGIVALAASMLAPGLVAALPVSAQATPKMPLTASAAPEDTAVFVSLNLDEGSTQNAKADELLNRLGLGSSWDDWQKMAAESMPSDKAISEEDMAALIGGEAAIAISPVMIERVMAAVDAAGLNSATPIADLDDERAEDALAGAFEDGMGIVAILQPGDPDRAWAYVERQMAAAADRAGGTVSAESYNGVEILSAPDSSFYGMKGKWGDDDDADGFGSGEIVTARVDDFILTATSSGDLEPAIDAAAGGASLAGNATLQELRAELPEEALAFAFANGDSIFGALDPDWLDFMVAQFEGTLTPDQVRELYDVMSGTAVWADDAGFRIDNLHIRPDGKPIPSIYGGPPSSDFADQVPAGTMIYDAGTLPRASLDQIAYSIALSVLAENDAYIEPATPQEVRELYVPRELRKRVAEAERYLGFNLQSGFFDTLDAGYGVAIGVPAISLTGVNFDAIMKMGTNDPAALASSLVKVARLAERSGEVDISARKIGQDTMYAVAPVEDAEVVPGVGFGVLGGDLVAGTESGIAAWQKGTDEPLSADPQFQRVMGLLPADAWKTSYVDFREIVPLVMQLAELGDMSPQSTDADAACAAYPEAAAAQAAFESEPLANSALDSDFDGIACEDYFMTAGATPAAASGSLENLRAFGMTAWERDGRMGWNMLLHIAEPGS